MFYNIVLENNDASVPSSYQFQTVSQQKSGSCICKHSQTAISTSALLYNWQPPKHCFYGSNKWCHRVLTFSTTIQPHTAYTVAVISLETWWAIHHMMNFWEDMSRLKRWVVNGTGLTSCTLVDFCVCGAERCGWRHDMRSKTETKQNVGIRSACC
jgi:hypothetical protein